VGIDYTYDLNFDQVNEEIHARFAQAIGAGLEHIRAVATPLVPVLTGNLAGSGGITVDGVEGRIRYPGPYALYQHEGVYYRHGRVGAPLSHTHGQAFYLSEPIRTEAETVIDLMGRILWNGL
jgi:hypothetical protein